MAQRRRPSGKKLLTLHVDGIALTRYNAKFLADVLEAARRVDDAGRAPDVPHMHALADGSLAVYVADYTV